MQRKQIIERLVDLQYNRASYDFPRGSFRVRGDSIDVYLAYEDKALRILLKDDAIQSLEFMHPVSAERTALARPNPPAGGEGGNNEERITNYTIYPAKHYMTDPRQQENVFTQIRMDLDAQVAKFKKENKLTEPEFNMYITINDVLECARICNNHNIIPLFSFMIGIPGEQREEIINTVKLMKQLRKICPKMESGMAVFMPYPGGELYSRITQERNFIEPKSLREWCKEDYLKSMDSENVSVSWNKNDEKYILDIHYYANLAYIMTKNQYKEMAKKNFIIASGLLFFVMLARMRWNMNFFSLAFDRRIYLFTKRVLNIL